jgi:hypothetical protein
MEESVISYQCESPVVLITFNRPDPTLALLDVLKQVTPEKIYVISDGPRTSSPGDEEKVAEVRSLVDKEINWNCSLVKIYSDINLTGPVRIPSGFDEVFKSEDCAIILEDDCIPSISFFRFCDELLVRYKNDKRIGTICGFNLEFDFWGNPIDGKRDCSYFFSRYPASWGWATWRRVWDNFDHEILDYPNLHGSRFFNSVSDIKSVRKFWERKLKAFYIKEKNNWDYKLIYTLLINHQLSIIPNESLVKNIGTKGGGTNIKNKDYRSKKTFHETVFPLKHPSIFQPDYRYDRSVSSKNFTSNKISKGFGLLRNFFS